MKNKSTNILLIILIITIIIVAFIALDKKDTSNDKLLEKTNSTSDLNKLSLDPRWNNLSKNKLEEIMSERKDVYFEKDPGLTLSQEMDLTGDSINEAIIEGNGGNNGVSFILIKNTDNEIEIANQKNKDGSISTVSLISIGRAMTSEGYELIPGKNGFYTISLELDEQADNPSLSSFKCHSDGLAFYSWNQQTKLFEWNKILTTEYTTKFCK